MGLQRIGHDWVTCTFTFLYVSKTSDLNFNFRTNSEEVSLPHFYRWRKPQLGRVTGEPQGHRAHMELGCKPREHVSKAVSPHVALALEHCGGTAGSLWHPGRSFLPRSRWWVEGGERVLVSRLSGRAPHPPGFSVTISSQLANPLASFSLWSHCSSL